MIHALLTVANFALVASLTMPILNDESLKWKREQHEGGGTEDGMKGSVQAESSEYEEELSLKLNGQELWPLDGSNAKCVDGPIVEDVSQAECQQIAVENR